MGAAEQQQGVCLGTEAACTQSCVTPSCAQHTTRPSQHSTGCNASETALAAPPVEQPSSAHTQPMARDHLPGQLQVMLMTIPEEPQHTYGPVNCESTTDILNEVATSYRQHLQIWHSADSTMLGDASEASPQWPGCHTRWDLQRLWPACDSALPRRTATAPAVSRAPGGRQPRCCAT